VLTWLGLTLLGVPLALILAVLAGLLAFIPNIGPVIAAVPAVLLSLLEGPQMALYVALLYIGVQTVESYLITPFIQRRTVSLPPALTIAAQFLLGMQAGGFGLFVATPLAAVGLTLAQRLRSPDDAPGDRARESHGKEIDDETRG
jgi:predicted PurR-regulated permease PerM